MLVAVSLGSRTGTLVNGFSQIGSPENCVYYDAPYSIRFHGLTMPNRAHVIPRTRAWCIAAYAWLVCHMSVVD